MYASKLLERAKGLPPSAACLHPLINLTCVPTRTPRCKRTVNADFAKTQNLNALPRTQIQR